MEREIGSIVAGKRAHFTVLERGPPAGSGRAPERHSHLGHGIRRPGISLAGDELTVRWGNSQTEVNETLKISPCAAALVAACVSACGGPAGDESPDTIDHADVIFVGEHIVTMDAGTPTASGVAVRGERIVQVGDRDSVMRLAGADTRIVELGDGALLPGFIDSHGHFSFTARLLEFANLSSPPVGTAENIGDVNKLLARHIADRQIPEGEWVLGYGYDDSLLAENRHPTRDDLDRVSTDHPIVLMHVSGHLAAVNSAALAAAGIDAGTDNPPGGVIRRCPGSREPNGVLEESAASGLVFGRLGRIGGDRFEALLRRTTEYYASFGITTAQDGAATPQDIAALRAMAAKQPFAIDIGAYPFVTALSDDELGSFAQDGQYSGGFRVAGVKFSLDGSPQGRTAWLTEPYAEGPPGAAPDYVAYPTTEPDYYKQRVAALIARNVPVLVHANGDAAMDLMIEGVAAAVADGPVPDHRSVIIHAQLMREDQVDRAAELGIVPSFFSAHTFFWGDWHRRSFGEQRAQNISPTRWALDKGVRFTVHNDAPVVPPDMMRLLWATVNRETRSGDVIGPHQRLGVTEALHAITLGGAYQFFEEDSKGSIAVGKQADLVILDCNPLTLDPGLLQDMKIVETFSRGRSVFQR